MLLPFLNNLKLSQINKFFGVNFNTAPQDIRFSDTVYNRIIGHFIACPNIFVFKLVAIFKLKSTNTNEFIFIF